MSRLVNTPLVISSGIEVKRDNNKLTIKGSKGILELEVHENVAFDIEDNNIKFRSTKTDKFSKSVAGTMRSLANNILIGVSQGFEKKLVLVGVGYRAQVKKNVINLSLGFSHPVNYNLPESISAESPSQTEIVIKGIDKQLVGQVAAEIRKFRSPEPYKGKGIHYANEQARRKEAKKK